MLRIEGNRVRTSVDSFPGHSGGVMIDLATGNAFGVHVEGSTPSYVGMGDCTRAAACDAATPDAGFCTGAVETSVDAFSSCCGSTPPPSPPSTCADRCGAVGSAGCSCDLACVDRGDCCADFATTCQAGSDAGACLGGGAPCESSADCSNVMCVCEGRYVTTESFIIPGRCSMGTCADLQQLCETACANERLDDQRFHLGWWLPACESD